MPMTAPHSADRDQWLMKGFGSPPDISHSASLTTPPRFPLLYTTAALPLNSKSNGYN